MVGRQDGTPRKVDVEVLRHQWAEAEAKAAAGRRSTVPSAVNNRDIGRDRHAFSVRL
jgi:hypothetical protein